MAPLALSKPRFSTIAADAVLRLRWRSRYRRGSACFLPAQADRQDPARAFAGVEAGVAHAAVEVDGVTGFEAHRRVQVGVQLQLALDDEDVGLAGTPQPLAGLVERAGAHLGD